ncbi:glycosyltransferase family 2 protein [Motilimonas cestriensis]|uniref:glycosyltransferase family 2 protein n=1 Tax=Motilimonas cestriensis TaxID=2742685 RepID=UPI003DA55B26
MANFCSIVIPSYNRYRELLACLDNLNSQTSNDFEVIVVDDFSSEPVRIDPSLYRFKVSLHRMLKNSGAAAARNFGASLACGSWLLFLDDDDFFDFDKVSTIQLVADRNRNINFIYHSAVIKMVNEKGHYITSVQPSDKLELNKLLSGNYIGGAPVYAMKKDLFVRVGGFDDSLKSIEDYENPIKIISFK